MPTMEKLIVRKAFLDLNCIVGMSRELFLDRTCPECYLSKAVNRQRLIGGTEPRPLCGGDLTAGLIIYAA
jgi:hypothetical protein